MSEVIKKLDPNPCSLKPLWKKIHKFRTNTPNQQICFITTKNIKLTRKRVIFSDKYSAKPSRMKIQQIRIRKFIKCGLLYHKKNYLSKYHVSNSAFLEMDLTRYFELAILNMLFFLFCYFFPGVILNLLFLPGYFNYAIFLNQRF